MTAALVTDAFFDGAEHHSSGPYTILLSDGEIMEARPGDASDNAAAGAVIRAPFVMPGLVESHAHLFLDGAELNFEARANHLKSSREEMLRVGRRNLDDSLNAGITLVRDAGDLHGINTRLKAELWERSGVVPEMLSAGRALRKAGRYGGFMALETTDTASIDRTVRELIPNADQLKILLTGIIDFATGQMKGGPQFNLDETLLMVRLAHDAGIRTFAHCSGSEGLRIALAAGVDCIEHGFFMEDEILEAMAEQGTAWTPTFSPVQFHCIRPEACGWDEATVGRLNEIIARHFENVTRAVGMGIPVLAGSDSGSYGVPHGSGLIDELLLLRQAGLTIEQTLAAAASTPRRIWNRPSADIRPGNQADLILLDGSPFEDMDNLRRVRRVIRGGATHECA